MDEPSATQLIESLQHNFFYFAKVRTAPSVGTFTQLHGTLYYHSPYMAKFEVESFFNISKEILMGLGNEEQREAVTRLLNVFNGIDSVSTLVQGVQSEEYETRQFVYIAGLFLKRLTGVCTLNKKEYSASLLLKNRHLELSDRGALGMGTVTTWHGTPDGRCDIIPVTSMDPDVGGYDEDSEDSSGGKSAVECKVSEPGFKEMNQIVGQSVVMSFTHHNRHPSQNPLVPSVAISGKKGVFCASLYDCVNDVLLHMQEVKWVDFIEKKLIKPAVFLLWLILNHKLFLKKLAPKFIEYKSELHRIFREAGFLEDYNNLYQLDVMDWVSLSLPSEPPMKKKRVDEVLP